MDTDELVTAARFYLRRLQRLSRVSRAPLPGSAETALWVHAETAAGRLRRLAALTARQRVPVPIKRRPA